MTIDLHAVLDQLGPRLAEDRSNLSGERAKVGIE